MPEQLEVNQSTDLLNEFLGQQDSPSIENTVIKEVDDDTNDGVERVTPNTEGLDLLTEVPEGFEIQEEAAEETEDKEVNKNTSADSQYSFKALAGYLSEEGIIDFEDGEGVEDTPEVLFESVKRTIDKEIQSYKDSIPERAKQVLEYLEKGGDIDTYLEKLQKPFDINNVDLTSESEQEKVVREALKLQGYDQEDIDESISSYKESLILDKQAKVADKQLKKYFKDRDNSILEEQEAIQEARKQEYSQYISNINTTIDSSDSLAGLPLTTKEKVEFKRYLTAVDKEGLTQYAKEVAEDPVKTQLELAYLKYMKYDFSKAIKAGETIATKKFKDIFKNNETNIKTGKSVDQAAESGSLDAFKSFLGKNK